MQSTGEEYFIADIEYSNYDVIEIFSIIIFTSCTLRMRAYAPA